MKTIHLSACATIAASLLSAPPANAQSCDADVIGSLSEPSNAAHSVGDIVYVLTQDELVTIDASDPDSPLILDVERVGLFFPGRTKDIASDGDRLYAYDFRDLAVFDIADPTNPELLATIDDAFLRPIAAGDGLLYAGVSRNGTRMNLDVIDASDPDELVTVGSTSLPNAMADVAYHEGLAYAALGPDGLAVIDVADPTNPTLRGVIDLPGTLLRIAVAGQYVYGSSSAGLQVIDVSDPDALSLETSIDTESTFFIQVVGDRLYTSPGNLTIFGISTPSAPELLAEVEVPQALAGYASAIFDDTAFVFRPLSPSRASLLDFSEPQSPVIRSDIAFPSRLENIAFAGDVVYGISGVTGDGPIVSFDVSDPESPRPLGAIYEIDDDDELFGRALEIDNDILVTIARGDIVTIDATNPSDLRVLDQVPIVGANGLALKDGLAAVAALELQLYDYSDPMNIAPLGATGTLNARQVALSDDFAYVATTDGFTTVDIADPTTPLVVGQLSLPAGLELIEAHDETAIATDAAGAIWIIDASDPASPVVTGSLDFVEEPTAISVLGNRVFVVVDSVVPVVEVSDGGLPAIIATINPRDNVFVGEVLVQEELAFITGGAGLLVLDPRGCFPRDDLTGDGLVTAADLAALIAAWGQSDSAADLDADGVVGESDLAILIAAWS
jgi:hypothetical protein